MPEEETPLGVTRLSRANIRQQIMLLIAGHDHVLTFARAVSLQVERGQGPPRAPANSRL